MSQACDTALGALAELRAVCASGMDEDVVAVVRETERINRASDLARVEAVGKLLRQRWFATRGYKPVVNAVRDFGQLYTDQMRIGVEPIPVEQYRGTGTTWKY